MNTLSELRENFEKLTNHPEELLNQGKLVDNLKSFLKHVYDFTLSTGKYNSLNALPELYITNFDEEQIWQELELQNADCLPHLISTASKLLVVKDLSFPVKLNHCDSELTQKTVPKGRKVFEDDVKAVSSEEDVSDIDDKNSEQEDQEDNVESNFKTNLGESDEESDDLFEEEKISLEKNKMSVKIKPSEVDDTFFKLSEMEAFLKDAEENEGTSYYDFFNDEHSDTDDEENRPKYEDFFRNPDRRNEINDVNEFDEGESSDNKTEDEVDHKDNNKKVRFSEITNSADNESDVSDSNEININSKSTFEKREEKLRNKISKLEDEALQEKHWTLKGEVSGDTRPVNSLLEEVVEFDLTQRPPPVITEETTNRLEDIIKQRIRDKAFDDVERKIKPVSTPHEFKKKLVLDQERSKLSLAEVYEQEYLKEKESKNPENEDKPDKEPEEHDIIRRMMKSLFVKLDALSDYYFVPRPIEPELQVVSNAPAITLEEVAPVGTTDAKLLAPEEVVGKFNKSLLGKEERSKTDKKRERRKKKVFQAQKFKEKAEKESGKPKTYSEELKKAMKFKNVTTLEETIGKATKTSKEFFSKLQDEVQSRNNQVSKVKRKQKTTHNAKRLKL